MIKKEIKKNNGFVVLFAIVISSILFSVALGLINVASKEILFSISNRASNDAFYAADTGVECALYWDLGPSFGGPSAFGLNPIPYGIATTCGNINLNLYQSNPSGPWTFYIHGLGRNSQACVKVVVTKNIAPPNPPNKIVASGYNIGDVPDCVSTNTNRVERQLEVVY